MRPKLLIRRLAWSIWSVCERQHTQSRVVLRCVLEPKKVLFGMDAASITRQRNLTKNSDTATSIETNSMPLPVNEDGAVSIGETQNDSGNFEDSGIGMTRSPEQLLKHVPNVPGFFLSPRMSLPAPEFTSSPCSLDVTGSSVKGVGGDSVCRIEETTVFDEVPSKKKKDTVTDVWPSLSSSVNDLNTDGMTSEIQPIGIEQLSGSKRKEANVTNSVKLSGEKINETSAVLEYSVQDREKITVSVEPVRSETEGKCVGVSNKNTCAETERTDYRYPDKKLTSARPKAKNAAKAETKPTVQSSQKKTPASDNSNSESLEKPKSSSRVRKRRKERASSALPGSPEVKLKVGASKTKTEKQTVLPAALLNQVVQTVQANRSAFIMETKSKTLPGDNVSRIPASTLTKETSLDADELGQFCRDRSLSSLNSNAEVQNIQTETVSVIAQTCSMHCQNVSGDSMNRFDSGSKINYINANSVHDDTTIPIRFSHCFANKDSSPELCEHSSNVDIEDKNASETKVEKGDHRNTDCKCAASESGTPAEINNEKTLQKPVAGANESSERESSKSVNKKGKKNRRKKKKWRSQEEAAGEGQSLVGILPDYIPENDSRLDNKTSEDKVYHLAALFSGKLGSGEDEKQRPQRPKKERPNYFFAIQITNPQVNYGKLGSGEDEKQRPQRPKKERPNYFFAIQITNPQIKTGLSSVLDAVEEAKPELKPAFVSSDSAHLTLAAIYLPDEDVVSRARTILDDLKELLGQSNASEAGDAGMEAAEEVVIDVVGIGHFNNSVVFAKVAEGQALDQVKAIADLLRRMVMKQEISIDSRAFAPHVTIMKLSKLPPKLKRSVRKIDPSVYAASNERHFGSETVTSVQLCSMIKPKQNNYYHIEHEVLL